MSRQSDKPEVLRLPVREDTIGDEMYRCFDTLGLFIYRDEIDELGEMTLYFRVIQEGRGGRGADFAYCGFLVDTNGGLHSPYDDVVQERLDELDLTTEEIHDVFAVQIQEDYGMQEELREHFRPYLESPEVNPVHRATRQELEILAMMTEQEEEIIQQELERIDLKQFNGKGRDDPRL